MHNRVGPAVESRELSLRDAAVLVPLVAVIVFFALYPQLALNRSQRSATLAVAPARLAQTTQGLAASTGLTGGAP
jgi:NADH:ubiquinone oxidoreductase subunit 4 (subunit M)